MMRKKPSTPSKRLRMDVPAKIDRKCTQTPIVIQHWATSVGTWKLESIRRVGLTCATLGEAGFGEVDAVSIRVQSTIAGTSGSANAWAT